MWKAIRENPKAVFYAVLMHLVLLVLLLVGLDWTPKAIKPGVREPVEAELVANDELKKIQQRKQEEQRRIEEEKKRKVEEQRKAEAEKQRKADEAKQKAEAEKKRKAELAAKKKAEAEKERKAEEARKKAEAEKKRKADEAAKKKAEAEKAKLAAKKAAAAEEKQRREAEAALQAQLAEEAARRQAENALEEFIPYIQDKIQRNWLRPPGSPAGLSCIVKVRLLPGGDVGSVSVARSSGDSIFDDSVERAVRKASPLPLPDDPEMFRYFREINFVFDPGR